MFLLSWEKHVLARSCAKALGRASLHPLPPRLYQLPSPCRPQQHHPCLALWPGLRTPALLTQVLRPPGHSASSLGSPHARRSSPAIARALDSAANVAARPSPSSHAPAVCPVSASLSLMAPSRSEKRGHASVLGPEVLFTRGSKRIILP